MTSVVHLWNISKFFKKIQNPEVAKLQMHYVQCCRELGDKVDLPKNIFGPAVLCPRCGSAWATTKHRTRVLPRRFPSRRIEHLIRMSHATDSKFSKYRRTLIRKCERNKTNKIIKICSVCSGSARFSLTKPERRKIPKANPLNNSNLKLSSKKKKKRTKDKTAGLNLSGSNIQETNRTKGSPQDKSQTPLLSANNKKNLGKAKTRTFTSKSQKMNLSKLKGLINTNLTPSKKSKLHEFLQEL